MTPEILNNFLIKTFPELKEIYESEIEWQDGDKTGAHIVYGDVFMPYLREVIDKYEISKIQEIFIFIEKILAFNDEYAEEVVCFSILEMLNSEQIEICRPYMKKITLRCLREIEKAYNVRKSVSNTRRKKK